MELDLLNNDNERDDLNFVPGKGDRYDDSGRGDRRGRDRDRDRGRGKDRGERRKEKGMDTFFINIGTSDKVNKGELLRMICDVSGIRGKDVGAIRIMKNHSYFDVMDQKSKGIEKKFIGLEFDGRKVRMNREDS